MATPLITVTTTPPDLFQRMQRYPQQLDTAASTTMQAALLHLQGSVPPYPAPPANSRYRRTGTLGRTLGVSQTGGVLGQPDIRLVRKLGSSGYEGAFGSNLNYAPDVIGEGTQKPFFATYWWTMKTVAENATAGIVRLYQVMADRMAAFLDGR